VCVCDLMKKSKQAKEVLSVIDPDNQFAHTNDLDSIIVYKYFTVYFKDDFLNESVERLHVFNHITGIKNIIKEESTQSNTLCVYINKSFSINHKVINIHIGKMRGVTRFLLKREIE
jgi:hypothetical protein